MKWQAAMICRRRDNLETIVPAFCLYGTDFFVIVQHIIQYLHDTLHLQHISIFFSDIL